MEQDRRRSPRYPFVGSIEMREGTSQDKRTARVKELSMNGCYVDTESPYPLGVSLAIKLFTETKPYYLMVLRKWLLSAMMGKKG
jgi:hypothetical protein